jgi:hypothetical protein
MADIIVSAFTGLIGQVRVGDQGPNHIHHIAVTVFQNLLR